MTQKITIQSINDRALRDIKEFIFESEERYANDLRRIARKLVDAHNQSPIILLTGPSSSGKTTTAKRISASLAKKGIVTHTISMDDYYKNKGEYPLPTDENGNSDLESPLCIDLDLLGIHLSMLVEGKEIHIPRFDFTKQMRLKHTASLQLKQDEMVIIEGIHAFNDKVTTAVLDHASKIYISLDQSIFDETGLEITSSMLRFMRRATRDEHYRSSPFLNTLGMWPSVRRGEKLYIQPFKDKAEFMLNSFLPYEPLLFFPHLKEKLLAHRAELTEKRMGALCDVADRFAPGDYIEYLPDRSILHEFV